MSKAPEGKFIAPVKVGPKGQIVIPKEARDMFGIESGDTIYLLADINRGIALPVHLGNEAFKKIYESLQADSFGSDGEE